MAERDLSYIAELRSHAEIQGVLLTVDHGLNEPFGRDEAVRLERRAIEIGGTSAQVGQIVINIRQREARASAPSP